MATTKSMKAHGYLLLILLVSLLSGCANAVPSTGNGKLDVLVTTTIVADVVQNVGGEHVNMVVLVPTGTDEHGYQPTPKDVVKVTRADLVFINGAGLEQFIETLVQNAGGQAQLVSVSEGIPLSEGPAHTGEEDHEGESHADGDPHVWTDPNNVLVWVDNIEKSLTSADPLHSTDYKKNAAEYRRQITELDGWIRDQVSQVPPERRKLVSDHVIFTYFASRYGFEQVGAIVPGYSTMTAPSARELAALEDAIRELSVPAIFVGNTVNPAFSETVTKDTNTRLVHILTGSLSQPGEPGATYIDYMKYNVQAIVEGLK